MPRYNEDDLFKDSTMTFGQHLGELQVCLFKAVLGLAVGVCIGFFAGFWVVDFIQTPLRKALENFYEKQAARNLTSESELERLREAGYDKPEDIGRMKEIIENYHVSFDVVYVDPKDLFGQAKTGSEGPGSIPSAIVAEGGDEAHRGSLKPIVLFRPLADDPRTRVKSLNAQEVFMIYLKASMLVGVIISSPWLFYQIWNFVAAGLYPHEKRYVHMFLPFSLGLFLTGAALAFFVVFEKVLDFLFSFNAMMGIDPDPRINEWMRFVLFLPLGFGLSFQLPLVMLFLERIGVFTVQAYLKSWRLAILSIFVLSMLLSPSGDPYSMLLMAGPLTVLYFGGILLCRYLPRRQPAFEES
jgi:sec-independent protein translocase protein TatC